MVEKLHKTRKPSVFARIIERQTPTYFRNHLKDTRKLKRFIIIDVKGKKVKINFLVVFRKKYGVCVDLVAETDKGKKIIGTFTRKHHYFETRENKEFSGIKNLELSRYAMQLLEEAEIIHTYSKSKKQLPEQKHRFYDLAQTPQQVGLLIQLGYVLKEPIQFKKKRFNEFLNELKKIKTKPKNELNYYDKSILQIEKNLKTLYPKTPKELLLKTINLEFQRAFSTNPIKANNSIDLLNAIFRKTKIAHDLWFNASFFKNVSNIKLFMELRKIHEEKRKKNNSLLS